MDKQTFINQIKTGAIQGHKDYNIFASVTMAQAILESGWGQFARGNNLFGIKWTEGCGYPSQSLPTKEFVNGQWENVYALFRAYPNYSESILDHSRLLASSIYKDVVNAKTCSEACQSLQKCGYATAPNYADTLISIIKANNLTQYDVIPNSVLQAFQKACGLTADGIEGPVTIAYISKINITKGAKGEIVKWLQQRLNDLGFKCGAVDGNFGYLTLSEVQNYQAKNGLRPDGVAGANTINKLIG